VIAIGGYLEGQRSPRELVILPEQLPQSTKMVYLNLPAGRKADQKVSLVDWEVPG